MSYGGTPKRILTIGGYRVVFIRGVGWECNCESWEVALECQHTVLAAALITLENAVVANGGSASRH